MSARYEDRHAALALAAKSGERWRAVLARNTPPGYDDPAFLDGIVRWIGTESGGNPYKVERGASTPTEPRRELGLTQIMNTESAMTEREMDVYIARGTSDDTRAKLAWKHFKKWDEDHPTGDGWDAQARVWRAKIRHGLPLMYKELSGQGTALDAGKVDFLRDGPAPAYGVLDLAKADFRPSKRLRRMGAKFAGGSWGVLVRFVTMADAVAGYYRQSWTAQGVV